jgi:hypothetical protein
MRAAPAVSVSCSGGLFWRLTQTLLPAAASAALSTWLLQNLRQPVWLAVPIVMLASVVAWRLARVQPAALVFDGQRWTCDGTEGQPELMLDLNRALLLRWTPALAGSCRWLAVERAEARPGWHALRVALFAPQAKVRAIGQPDA